MIKFILIGFMKLGNMYRIPSDKKELKANYRKAKKGETPHLWCSMKLVARICNNGNIKLKSRKTNLVTYCKKHGDYWSGTANGCKIIMKKRDTRLLVAIKKEVK